MPRGEQIVRTVALSLTGFATLDCDAEHRLYTLTGTVSPDGSVVGRDDLVCSDTD